MVNESKKNFDTSVTLSGLRLDNPVAVSYTHLTLPTNSLV